MRGVIPGFVLAVILTATAFAQPPDEDSVEAVPAPSEADDAEGQALFQAGRHAFDDGRFDEALELFRRAQTRSGRPALHYNVGLAADRGGHAEEALAAYEAFVAGDPDNTRVRMVSARIEVLRRQLEQAASPTEVDPGESDPADDQDEPPPPEGRRRVISYVLLGAGVALGAAATAVWLRANSDFDALDRDCSPTCADADVDAVERKVRWTNGLMFSGIAVGVGAVLAFILEGRSTQVDAAVSAEGARVGVRHAF